MPCVTFESRKRDNSGSPTFMQTFSRWSIEVKSFSAHCAEMTEHRTHQLREGFDRALVPLLRGGSWPPRWAPDRLVVREEKPQTEATAWGHDETGAWWERLRRLDEVTARRINLCD